MAEFYNTKYNTKSGAAIIEIFDEDRVTPLLTLFPKDQLNDASVRIERDTFQHKTQISSRPVEYIITGLEAMLELSLANISFESLATAFGIYGSDLENTYFKRKAVRSDVAVTTEITQVNISDSVTVNGVIYSGRVNVFTAAGSNWRFTFTNAAGEKIRVAKSTLQSQLTSDGFVVGDNFPGSGALSIGSAAYVEENSLTPVTAAVTVVPVEVVDGADVKRTNINTQKHLLVQDLAGTYIKGRKIIIRPFPDPFFNADEGRSIYPRVPDGSSAISTFQADRVDAFIDYVNSWITFPEGGIVDVNQVNLAYGLQTQQEIRVTIRSMPNLAGDRVIFGWGRNKVTGDLINPRTGRV